MNPYVAFSVFTLLVAVLILLHRWQRRIEDAQHARVLDECRDAAERGSDAPVAQHPQIDLRACIGCGACVAACPEEGVLGLVGGVARVIHGSRCVGHGLCADACPVGAVTIGLGELAKSPDLPVLSDRFETAVPGVFIVGELGGLSLIRNAVAQGVRAIDGIAAELRANGGSSTSTIGDVADVLIVGAGPAGFGASLRAIERGLRYVTIDQEDDIGGTVRKYPRRKLTLTGPLTLPLHGRVKKQEFLKEELIALWERIVADHEVVLRGGTRLLGLAPSPLGERVGVRGHGFVADTSRGPIAARRVLLALGRRGTPRKLGVPGEEQEKVLYSLVDAATYRGERIHVVGGGDSAAEAAVALAERGTNVVTLSYRRERFFRLKRRNEERLQRLIAEGRIRARLPSHVRSIGPDAVTLAVGAAAGGEGERLVTLPNDYVLVLAGGEPPYPLLRSIGIRFGGDGEPAEPAAAGASR